MYTNFSIDWDFEIPCPPYVRMLDPACVALDGVVYWLTFGGYEEDKEPPFIVSFSCLDCTFNQISIPLEAESHYQALLVRQGQLCMAANNHDQETFSTVIWGLNQVDGYPSWLPLYMYEGVGPSYRPFFILDDDEIQTMERHIGVFGLEQINLTHFHITRYNVGNQTRQSLQWIEYDEDVKLRSLFHCSETVFTP
ncbi:hypothetical protein PIB30_049989 [Stylosanthes scabra]|uniref:F-box associated domain-containing protein n=1 Tax=Stylosanthes scabra TaxID=79078 RepID=A0ABU6RHJ0_9FABA|nr:hypothetical protein [Stylosanthes scabra]